MKHLISLSLLLMGATGLSAQSHRPAAINEDYSWNIRSDAPRSLRYHPAGNGVEITDGTGRFNRALYGAHTGFRMECSDLPEFGLYLPRMGGNLRFEIDYRHCTARYEAGRMLYRLDDRLTIEAQVLRSDNAAMWRIENRGDREERIGMAFGGVADVKFYREGDLGVDKPDCFDFKPEYCAGNRYTVEGRNVRIAYGRKEPAELRMTLPTDRITITDYPSLQADWRLAPKEVAYVAIYPAATAEAGVDCTTEALPTRFAEAEAQRAELAGALTIRTPDPYITPIGEALALAADGIWSGEVWLHGAVGWRAPYSGWRGAYVGDALGWHERARKHFNTYAANQITDIPAIYPHPTQDSTLNLARSEKRWGTQMYSNGYIARRPGKKEEMSHYDMNLCYIDELLRHLDWTGDLEYAREIFPVIERHLDWEKRNYDPDGDHLYDAYCCIWASDALYYTSGAVTHSSAYNYFANRRAAEIARLIGRDGDAYDREADAILEAMNRVLWMNDRGHWAEYQDFMGHKRLHPDAAVWTIYHALDSECADRFQARAAVRYVEREIPHISLNAQGLDKDYALISTSCWKPYSWSINNVAIAEVMHTALAYFQAGCTEEAFHLMKSTALDNMYLGGSPLNFGQISHLDAARGECYRDFADPIGVWSRALVEGLYGIRPDQLHHRITLAPGFPAAWNEAEIEMCDLGYTFRRAAEGKGWHDTYRIHRNIDRPTDIRLEVRARGAVKQVLLNGRKTRWELVEPSIDQATIAIECGSEQQATVEIVWAPLPTARPTKSATKQVGDLLFREVSAGSLRWWRTEEIPHEPRPVIPAGFDAIETAKCEPIAMTYNASVGDIFRNRYLSPRSPYTTLQIPEQGIGEWCHPKQTAEISDAGLRALVDANGLLNTSIGIPFRTPAEGNNIAYTSLWDNYPDRTTVALSGHATHAYLMMAGSTNHMQYGIANGVVRVHYTDGTTDSLELVNPMTWVPIEQDLFYDNGAFRIEEGTTPPLRIHLRSGRISRHLGDELGIEGVYGREIDDGAGLLLDLRLDADRELASLEVETLSNDVVIGLMAVTLQRPTTPRPETRPYVRWWWLGSAVDRPGLDYNLSEFARQGIGGVEITPIYGVQGNESNDLAYLSPEWMEAYRYTVERGMELGLQIDMSNCTGWPFGGAWISTDESAQKYILECYEVAGGQQLTQILQPADPKQQAVATIEAVQAVNNRGERVDLLDRVTPDKQLNWKAPEGAWKIYALYAGRTFQKVKRAAPGGEGLVLNHYNRSAVEHYLAHFDEAFAASGAPWPDTFFNDSFEVYGSNWDTTILAEFEKDHGYRLQDYLPEFAAEGADDLSARIVRDYRETLAAMLYRNFTTVWTEWAHSHGCRVRNQAHGSPGNIFDYYARVDIPECESFGCTDFPIEGLRHDPVSKPSDADPAVLKFASSAAHVTGKPLTSCETLTWLTEHFHTSLSACKPEIDQILASGVNHVYFHGAPYSPAEAKFPGWLFYASVNMSPTATLWEDADGLFAYITRCQEFLQAGKPDNDLLLYIPMEDISMENRGRNLLLFDIHKMGRTMPHLKQTMNALVRGGVDADYISDRYLATATVDAEGRIVTEGGATYAHLVMPDCQLIRVETLRKVLDLAREGATVVFIGSIPDDVPGYGRLEERRAELAPFVAELQPIIPLVTRADVMLNDAEMPLGRGWIRTYSRLENYLKAEFAEIHREPLKKAGCQLIRRTDAAGKRYFVSLLEGAAIDGWVTLGTPYTPDTQVVLTDPITGQRGVAQSRATDRGTEIALQLRPGESVLIDVHHMQVENPIPWKYLGAAGNAIEGEGWTLSFPKSDPAVNETFTLSAPRSWCGLSDTTDVLCGTGVYRATFRVKDPASADCWILDLGDVRESARVRINGHEVGTAWSIPFRMAVGGYLQAGANEVEIEVTNLPANRIADMDRRGMEWRIFKDANVAGVVSPKLDTSAWPQVPSGLNSPVRLIPYQTSFEY